MTKSHLPHITFGAHAAVTIREAYPDDDAALRRLAALDSRSPLTGRVILAEQDGELRAALSLDDGTAIADPFRFTASLVALLRLHAGGLAAKPAPARRTARTGRRSLLPRAA